MSKISLITGISGQDGAYLAELLLRKGHTVIGVARPGPPHGCMQNLRYLKIDGEVQIVSCDLCSIKETSRLIKTLQPDEIYNLAAQSSVRRSFIYPQDTLFFNYNSVVTLLESVRVFSPHTRVYQASSSEMFGNVNSLPITEDSILHPLSPYAVTKAAAHLLAKTYRESFGVFVACGILFNHESCFRSVDFFVKKVICEALDVAEGKRQYITVGDLSVRRDFGFAPLYVEAMYLMLQHAVPEDFIICSGSSISLQEIVDHICMRTGVGKHIVHADESLFRPQDIKDNYGSNAKARALLGWSYNLSFTEVLDILLETERNCRLDLNS